MSASEKDLVYGEVNNGLVFMPRAEAVESSAIHQREASTWGELKRGVSDARWEEIQDRVVNGDEIDLESEFDPSMIRGFDDGDWPAWPARTMLDWMPAPIRDQFGRVDDTLLSGTFLFLDPSDEREIVELLEGLEYSCEEDELLVLGASGYD